ncbi:MAG: hypothetical protein IIW43_03920 [Selenomonadales bacterium]|nr:hypothetical protein [Selenomonadales bacterium]
MGYYANVDGIICPFNDEAKETILRFLSDQEYFEFLDVSEKNSGPKIQIWQYEKYWEDEYYEFFDKTRGLINNGLIECVGEDGELWCFEKRSWDEDWVERNGRVVYDYGSNTELIAQLIEVFEDFLDDRGIVLDNDEKAESGESAANVYGTDYGEIQTSLETVLRNWGILK